MIAIAPMRELCKQLHAVMAERVFGISGVDGLFAILETVRELYRHVEPVRVKGTIVVYFPIATASADIPASAGVLCGGLDLMAPQAVGGLILEVRADGRRYLHRPDSLRSGDLAPSAVVYEYRDGRERFYAGGEYLDMIRLIPTAHSQFSVPTFFNLREALLEYAAMFVRQSACPIFEDIWADANRLFLKPAPEKLMRRSLMFFLKVRLGASYEVRPEQVMDESHPVDIKVTFTPARRLMIIEIKWLGDSRNENGGMGTGHRDARAKAGAEQLAGYLDQNRVQAPLHVSNGYYVIIDARRRGLRDDSTTISKADGMFYAEQEIEFDVRYDQVREDFDPPYRMFAEPKHLP